MRGDVFIRPDTQRFLEKLKRQQEAKLNAQEADNRPFVLKYVSEQRPLLADDSLFMRSTKPEIAQESSSLTFSADQIRVAKRSLEMRNR